jgi:ATP-dependent Clp protease ATP-binding subunit ClpA
MFERFTREARSVVARAAEDARTYGHDHIGTEHLLLGLLGPDAGTSRQLLLDAGLDAGRIEHEVERRGRPSGFFSDEEAEALRTVGIDVEAVLQRMEQTFGPDAVLAPPSPRRGPFRRARAAARSRFTPRAKKVLELSLREAIRCQDDHIGSEHILLGLLREGRGCAVSILREAGVDIDALRRSAMAAVRKAA